MIVAVLAIAAVALSASPTLATAARSTPVHRTVARVASNPGPGVVPHEHQPSAAAAPPGSGDPNQPHQDPGAWPGLILVIGLFVVGIVLRGSRSRNRRRSDERRRRQGGD